jgi:hypothetical protein
MAKARHTKEPTARKDADAAGENAEPRRSDPAGFFVQANDSLKPRR